MVQRVCWDGCVVAGLEGVEFGVEDACVGAWGGAEALEMGVRGCVTRGCRCWVDIRTWAGVWRVVSRSCWRVRSAEVCFWKFWRALDGPQRLSAMVGKRSEGQLLFYGVQRACN